MKKGTKKPVWPFEICATLHVSHLPEPVFEALVEDATLGADQKPSCPLPVFVNQQMWPGGYTDSSIMVHCPEDFVDEIVSSTDYDIAPELLTIVLWANSHGVEYLRFDVDGDVISELPVYEE